MDALADVLGRARATGALFAVTELHGRGGLALPSSAALSVHVVSRGRLWLQVDDDVVPLAEGDVVLVRAPVLVGVLAGPREHATPLAALLTGPGARAPGPGVGHLVLTGTVEAATLLCGAYTLSGSVCARLLDALPPVARVRAEGGLARVVDLLVEELGTALAGQQTALDRLLDLLLVHGLRAYWGGTSTPPWYAGATDPVLGPALRALHADPARRWTVEALARTAGLSRAAFARRFTAVVGEPPLTYLTAWRMVLAQDALRREGSTVAAVAREVGYGSEFALSAAFTRHVGEPPSHWRARARAG